ncbi:Transposase [Oopsacas minuta]|uniref:Transposase n=1 Tax=Oopsacas minuta TaxID=111878 RepID=A0AAV7KEI7_9METZ|nr:Transposase [Oopsacas minuta]
MSAIQVPCLSNLSSCQCQLWVHKGGTHIGLLLRNLLLCFFSPITSSHPLSTSLLKIWKPRVFEIAMSIVTTIEFRTILKFHLIQIFSELQEIICRDCPSRSTVERWAARFRSGDADVTDLPQSGRAVSTTTSENIVLIESMVMEDKCITVNQLEQSMEISSGAIHTILTTELGYRAICGKWVPYKLSENQRLARLNITKKLLETYENCYSRRLTEIITDDETWVYYSTPYSEYKKRSWVRGDEQPAKIPWPDFRKPKSMYIIFFSSHPIVLQLPCESGKAVTATFFTEQVLPNLIKNIQSTARKPELEEQLSLPKVSWM